MRITYAQAAEYEDWVSESTVASVIKNESFTFDPLNFSEEHLKQAKIHFEAERNKPFDALSDDTLITVIRTERRTEYKISSNGADGKGFQKSKKLPGNEFLNTTTGRVSTGKKKEKRSQNNANMSKSIDSLRRLIDDNFRVGKVLFITLENLNYINDEIDHNAGKQEFNRLLDKLRYLNASYIWCYEPNIDREGTDWWSDESRTDREGKEWRHRIFVRLEDEKNLAVLSEKIQCMWEHDSISIKTVENIDVYSEREDVGIDILYRSYLRKFYKSGTRLFGCSKDMKRWKAERITIAEMKKELESCPKKIDEKDIKITKYVSRDKDNIVNVVRRITYERIL